MPTVLNKKVRLTSPAGVRHDVMSDSRHKKFQIIFLSLISYQHLLFDDRGEVLPILSSLMNVFHAVV